MWRFAVVFLCLEFILTACGGAQKKSNRNRSPDRPTLTRYFIHGDPNLLIADTDRNTSGWIAAANRKQLDGFSLQGLAEFHYATEKSKVKEITTQEALEQDNQTTGSEAGSVPADSNYVFETVGDRVLYRDARPDFKNAPVFGFSVRSGQLKLNSVNDIPVEELHYSIKDDGSAASLLFRAKEEAGDIIVAVFFVKLGANTDEPQYVDAPNNFFLRGAHAIPWKKPISISVCGKNAEEHEAEVQSALSSWSSIGAFKPGFIGRQPYSVTLDSRGKPFSDLNQNCIRFIEGYRAEDQDNIAIMGLTMTPLNPVQEEILAANIFIFVPAIARVGQPIEAVVTHELGHGLGLGHAFNNLTEDYESIMGYSGVNQLTSDDSDAIRLLYNSGHYKVSRWARGSSHFCSLSSEGEVACWGSRYLGILGSGRSTENEAFILGDLPPAIDLAVDDGTSCLVGKEGSVYCWGQNSSGVLNPENRLVRKPIKIEDLPPAERVFLGPGLACLRTRDFPKQLKCWGQQAPQTAADQKLLQGLSGAQEIIFSKLAICGLMVDQSMRCLSRTSALTAWNQEADSPGPFKALMADPSGPCALAADGELSCRGAAIGVPSYDAVIEDKATFKPVAELGLLQGFSVYDETGCAINAQSQLLCWGKAQPQMSVFTGRTEAFDPGRLMPPIGTGHPSEVRLGMGRGCVRNEKNKISCWTFPSSPLKVVQTVFY